MARSEVSEACIEGPGYKNYHHNLPPRKVANSSLLGSIPTIMPAPSQDDALLSVIMKFRNPSPLKNKSSNKFNYVIKHNGQEMIKKAIDF